MKVLLVPDVHEHYQKLLALEDKIEQAERVVLLGDFWDTFHPKGQAGLVATWVLSHLYDPKFTFLFGNHDCHYAFDHQWFMCSGYRRDTKALLKKEFNTDAWKQFKVWTKVGPFVVSHAGFHPKTLDFMKQEVIDEALERAFKGEFHPLWHAGYASGGMAEFGGPTWLRWWELKKLDFLQIVGHTQMSQAQKDKLGNWNLDTGLKQVAWVDDETGKIEIETV